ncbi:hypothetical protein cyc_04848 [Cyclospora cayetanensis]|uniref:Uncharacterized protein n=1 Tax=Cyclospora cayetanensis TaxID=88456 RepID=A0A1D3D0V9_9EIME|nr:hypothetical protein cyc_04848 [Cyclospora cayetanensis]
MGEHSDILSLENSASLQDDAVGEEIPSTGGAIPYSGVSSYPAERKIWLSKRALGAVLVPILLGFAVYHGFGKQGSKAALLTEAGEDSIVLGIPGSDKGLGNAYNGEINDQNQNFTTEDGSKGLDDRRDNAHAKTLLTSASAPNATALPRTNASQGQQGSTVQVTHIALADNRTSTQTQDEPHSNNASPANGKGDGPQAFDAGEEKGLGTDAENTEGIKPLGGKLLIERQEVRSPGARQRHMDNNRKKVTFASTDERDLSKDSADALENGHGGVPGRSGDSAGKPERPNSLPIGKVRRSDRVAEKSPFIWENKGSKDGKFPSVDSSLEAKGPPVVSVNGQENVPGQSGDNDQKANPQTLPTDGELRKGGPVPIGSPKSHQFHL